jgi:hypothetical protein
MSASRAPRGNLAGAGRPGEIRELKTDERNEVNRGFLLSSLGAFAVGCAVGYGIRRGVDALLDWLF